ncbi:hypothetical protein NE237_001780 [Protea cynaroides]|uniref:PORR domain-containing protein n=1 Tax=Protea cynaroides TaxID=273540 RepID=A0A9Q0KUS7_9MAGN|nr:hypothetical protein NE237_001780 [Protea cynaroides]
MPILKALFIDHTKEKQIKSKRILGAWESVRSTGCCCRKTEKESTFGFLPFRLKKVPPSCSHESQSPTLVHLLSFRTPSKRLCHDHSTDTPLISTLTHEVRLKINKAILTSLDKEALEQPRANVKNLRKLLMMSNDCRIPLENIEFVETELVLPRDFKESLIPKYPDFFSVKDFNGKAYLHLESWDSSLAITSCEEKLDIVATHDGSSDFSGSKKRAKISRDGNFSGPCAFRMNFPAGFRPNTKYLEEPADPRVQKRAVAVLHKLFSLIMEKRMSSAKLDAFHAEYQLPRNCVCLVVKNHGTFYIRNKGVFLKEAYDGSI